MRKDPILLTGVYRSGTTILSCMLDAHPELNFTYGSVNYLRWFVKKQISPDNYKKIVSETKSRLYKRYGKVIDYEKIVKSIEGSQKCISHALIYSSIMDEYFGYSEKRWGEKTLMEWTNIPTFLKMYPEGKALHIIRDPRDVLASFKGMTFEPGKRYLDAIFACMHSMDYCLHYKKTLPKSKYYAVRYESLIMNPRLELRKISDFLGIQYSEKMMDKSRYKDQFGDNISIESHTSYNDNSLPIGRWKNQLINSDIALIEGLLSNQLYEFDYCDSNNKDKVIKEFMSIITSEELLKSRFINFLKTGEGCEEYPSDPTKEENWTVLGKKDKGASSLYLRNKSNNLDSGEL
jgi:hypothetical protein